MTGDSKDARTFFAVKKREKENNLKPELGKGIAKEKAECEAHEDVKQYTHNFGDFVFSKSKNFISNYHETL